MELNETTHEIENLQDAFPCEVGYELASKHNVAWTTSSATLLLVGFGNILIRSLTASLTWKGAQLIM